MAKTVKENPYISILVYGEAGSGKSIFASTFPNALVLDFDNGHKQSYRENFKHTYVDAAQGLSALQKAVEQLKTGEFKFDTIIIDSLTNLENVAVANAKGMYASNWEQTLYTGKGKKLGYDEWGQISGSTIALLTYLRNLPVNVVIVTQLETTYDQNKEMYKPNLIGKGANEARHFADYLGFMAVSSTQDGTVRYLHLSSVEGDRFVAKGRFLSGDVEPIKNPNYEKLLNLIKNDKPALDFSD